MLDMISFTVKRQATLGYRKSLLLGSEIILRTGMYERDGHDHYLEIVPYDKESEVRTLIEAGKTKENLEDAKILLRNITHKAERENYDCIIFGCTELALVCSPSELSFPVLETVDILASETIKYAYKYRDWETDRKSTRLNSSHRL